MMRSSRPPRSVLRARVASASPATASRTDQTGSVLEWVRVIGPIVVSWPTVALLGILMFSSPLERVFNRFVELDGSKAELGPIKLELGKTVIPPQYRSTTAPSKPEATDLAKAIGPIGDSGPEGTTVGFALAYALNAAIFASDGVSARVSPRGIYVLAKKHDEWPGEDYEGTSLLGAVKALKSEGAYLAQDWPYQNKASPLPGKQPAYRISGFTRLKTIEDIQNALRQGKVAAVTIKVTNDFDTPGKDGRVTVKLPLGGELGAKAIAIVGYTSESAEFKFANDWGKAWGNDGFGIIRDTDLSRLLIDGYTVDVQKK